MKQLFTILTALFLVSDVYGQTAETYFYHGLAKYNLENYRGAVADYTKAIELNPNDADAYYNRGLCKIKLGLKGSVCLDLSKAGELGYANAYEAIQKLCN